MCVRNYLSALVNKLSRGEALCDFSFLCVCLDIICALHARTFALVFILARTCSTALRSFHLYTRGRKRERRSLYVLRANIYTRSVPTCTRVRINIHVYMRVRFFRTTRTRLLFGFKQRLREEVKARTGITRSGEPFKTHRANQTHKYAC